MNLEYLIHLYLSKLNRFSQFKSIKSSTTSSKFLMRETIKLLHQMSTIANKETKNISLNVARWPMILWAICFTTIHFVLHMAKPATIDIVTHKEMFTNKCTMT